MSGERQVRGSFRERSLKPVRRPEILEGEHVRLFVSAVRVGLEDPLELAARVYRGLSPEEIDEIERVALD